MFSDSFLSADLFVCVYVVCCMRDLPVWVCASVCVCYCVCLDECVCLKWGNLCVCVFSLVFRDFLGTSVCFRTDSI